MGDLFEVKEFEMIMGNENYKEQYRYMDKDIFSGLMCFIREFDFKEEESDILDFVKLGHKRNLGDTVTFKNYVGIIQMKNNFQIQVLPKLSFGSGEKDETKRVFMNMLRSMKDFPSKIFSNTNLNIERMNLYEIFINMYLQETRLLVKHGIKSGYVGLEENLNKYKGKLLINEHIKRNMTHKERFYIGFDEFQVDRAENRLIKSTLLLLQKLTKSSENSKEIRQLLTAFEMVHPSDNYDKDFSKVVINRMTKDYDTLMKWSKVFLKNKSFMTFSGSENAKALLFPMEKDFESYVGKNMKNVFKSAKWRVSSQDKGHYLFDQLNGEVNKKFALRPDFVVTKDDGKVVVLDTKWKRLIPNTSKNYGISQSDMYQMYAYAKKYDTSEIWLLYPKTDEMKDNEIISFASEDNVSVTVFFVNVVNIEQSMKDLMIKLKNTESKKD